MKVVSSRRMFLVGAGGAMLAIPLLSSLLPKEARAQGAGVPKRYVSLWTSYDYGHPRHWYPTLQPLAQTMTKPGEAPVRYQALRALLGGRPALSRVLGAGLTKHLGSINLMRGLDFIEYFGHGWGHNFGNLAGTVTNDKLNSLTQIPTIDHVLGRSPKVNVAGEPFLVANQANGATASYGPNGGGAIVRKTSAASTPSEIYQSLFRGGAAPEAGQKVEPHPRADVLSRVLEDYKRVRSGPQISALDRTVLDNAVDKLSDVQRNLAKQATLGCAYKGIPRTFDSYHFDSKQTLKNIADLIVAGMMCDLNRVYHFTGYVSDAYYNRSSEEFHNGHSHQPLATVGGRLNHEYMADIQGQFAANFLVPLLDGMASAMDTNGKSVLYNSLVHWSIEHGTVHSFSDIPTLFAGNAGGALTSGHMIDYTNPALFDGAFNVPAEGGWSGDPGNANWAGYGHGLPANRALVTALQAMGLQRADYERTDINRTYVNRTGAVLGARNDGIAEIGGYGLVGLPDPRQSSWEMYGHHRYHDYDLRYFKDPLPLPPASAA